MSNQGWRLVSGFVVLAVAGFGIYGYNKREKMLSFDCSSSPKHVTIEFTNNNIPGPNTGTLVCKNDALETRADVDFTIQFLNTDCFAVQSYQSTGHLTAWTGPIKNPGSGVFSSGIGECKYSIIVGPVTHDPHVIIMK